MLGYRWTAYDRQVLGYNVGTFISIAKNAEDCLRAQTEFLHQLFFTLKQVADYNYGKEWGQQIIRELATLTVSLHDSRINLI